MANKFADFVKKKSSPPVSRPIADAETKKQIADKYKFKTAWEPELATQPEVSKENLAEQSASADQDAPATDTNEVNTSDTLEANESDNETHRPSSKHRHSANTTRRRNGSQGRSPFRGFDGDYPLSSEDERELDVPKDFQMDSLKESQRLVRAANNLTDAASAQRYARNAIPDTPLSYPETSDGQITERYPSPTPRGIQIQKTRDSGLPSGGAYSPLNANRQLSYSERTQGADGNMSEHGVRYMVTQAQNYHKQHARQRSQPPPVGPRKPTPGGALVRLNSEGVQAEGSHPGPHREKAYDVLGLPENQDQPKYEYWNQDAPPHRDRSGSLVVNSLRPENVASDQDYDYDRSVLHDKAFSELMSESFDNDPRNPHEIDLTAGSLPTQLGRLARSTDEPQKQRFFESLTLQEWKQAGEWFNEQFASIENILTQKREERREVAKRFEQDVAKRGKAVKRETIEVDAHLKEMKNNGGKVLQVRASPQRRVK